jgi:hypothetical protein
MRGMRYIVCVMSLFLLGCPLAVENDSYCKKVMVCQDDRESFCDRNLDGCGENCYYYVVENCWEECKRDVLDEGR